MTTISSKLNTYITYPKQKKLYKNDKNRNASVYRINLTNEEIPVVIALGEIKYDQKKHNIAYSPVYLVLGDGIANKITFKPIGIYEFWASAEENLKDKEGDLDLHLIEGPLLYKGINSKWLKKQLNNKPLLKDISEREEEDLRQARENAVNNNDWGLIGALEDEMKDLGVKTGESIAKNAKPMMVSIVMDDDDDVDIKEIHTRAKYVQIVKEYEQMGINAKPKNWLQKKFHNHNYKIIPNRGAGDCFFLALKHALEAI